jgi:NTE family protein
MARLAGWWRAPRVGLALSGGGARGLAHLGVLEVLETLGIVPSAIAGTSAGSILGAARAAEIPIARMKSVAETAQWTRLVRPVLPGSGGLFSLAPLDQLLEDVLGPKRRFEDLSIPFACLATDVERDQPVVLRSGPIAPAVRASCSVPGVFAPVEHQGRVLVDGGVMNNLPVRLLREMGAEYVIGVDLIPARTKAARPTSLIEVMTFTFYNMVRATSGEGLLADTLIVPDIRDFSFADFRERDLLIARGREATTRATPMLSRDLRLGRVPALLRWLRFRAELARVITRLQAIWGDQVGRRMLSSSSSSARRREPVIEPRGLLPARTPSTTTGSARHVDGHPKAALRTPLERPPSNFDLY